MRCPYCHIDDKDRVIDSRPVEEGQAIRRRRVCEHCSRRYTTYERIEETVRLQIIKKDRTRVPYDRNKLLAGVQKACYKRPVSGEQIAKIIDAVEEEVSRTGKREVESAFMGEIVMKYLRRIDAIAYVRFASVYREFRDVQQLVDEAKQVIDAGQLSNPDQQDLFA
jgi:transcriptional repressor NrdR